jgi:hypothetical protein
MPCLSRTSLRKLSKEQLVNKVLSVDWARRGAWKEYYEMRDWAFRVCYPSIAKKDEKQPEESEYVAPFVLRALIQYQGLEGKISCPICLDEFSTSTADLETVTKALTALKCGHIFCEKCIKEWGKDCPLCRK